VRPRRSQTAAADKPIALTLKIDGDMYVRLSTLRGKERRTHQDILKQAFEEYLDRARA
jgi:predicted transcriptional regulator